jgi:FkbM family methyltransferase
MQSYAIEELLKLVDIQRLQPLVVDVGASDGFYTSNSYDLIVTHGWSAILFEPQADKLAIAKRLHEGRHSRVVFQDCAISEHDQLVVMYGHKNDGDGSTTLNHGASLLPLQYSPRQWPVRSISYQSFVSMIGLDKVGVLSLDTEGYDFNILRGLFESTQQRPQVIVTERFYPWDHKKLLAKMALLEQEYDCRYNGIDQIFIKKDLDNG